jgi:RecG-like helicase
MTKVKLATTGRVDRVAVRVADARQQARLLTSGIIRTTETITVGNSPTCRCEFSDGSGEIDLLFLGRATIPGLVAGRHVAVEGMVGRYHGVLTIWNPRYQLEPADDAGWCWHAPMPEAG